MTSRIFLPLPHARSFGKHMQGHYHFPLCLYPYPRSLYLKERSARTHCCRITDFFFAVDSVSFERQIGQTKPQINLNGIRPEFARRTTRPNNPSFCSTAIPHKLEMARKRGLRLNPRRCSTGGRAVHPRTNPPTPTGRPVQALAQHALNGCPTERHWTQLATSHRIYSYLFNLIIG